VLGGANKGANAAVDGWEKSRAFLREVFATEE
jgi:hypothetical protein